MNKKKKSIGVMFGGRSAEHEISVITALQAMSAIDSLLYDVVPIYVHSSGKWYTGESLLERQFYQGLPDNLLKVQEVTLLPDPSVGGLLSISKGKLSLDKVIPIDVYFLAFHGQYGEDGCIQGLLELANVAYTGCNVIASSVAMNKYLCKVFLQGHGIPTLPSILITRKEALKGFAEVQKKILSTKGLENFPLFVKPCHLGSSIGISVADDVSSLQAALAKVFRYDDEALIEPCITQLLEINVSVVDGDPPMASVVEIPVASGQALTYEDKYLRGGSKSSGDSHGMASLTRIIDPQELDDSIKLMVSEYAITAFKLLGCSGVSRFDFICDNSTGTLYFNELNAIPGSLSYYLWEKSTPPLLYTDLIRQLIEQAQNRKSECLAIQKDIGFKALLK